MIAPSEIKQMTLPEKLELLEAVWSEIASDPDQVEVPQWHKDILDERQRAFEEGRDKAIDWEEAKRQIEKAIR
ncbi:addiction module protein [Roseimicrobium sp. ORNL1]|uniref:addiction module protein n=1 Tax=Roseimicrobium sp. ORNL1 TaxID=2711231 RepID=UPI0013E1EE76|nr:addiction module protein [Roseimicrobium sp. ORNL1]QIF05797.1 addiction module protein [Roseimicrobium sp. ORNL1]